MAPQLHIGCSGFNYSDWTGVFYPPGLPQRRWLEHYCTIFDTVELNITFYRLPLIRSFETWNAITPDNFAFSLKGSRYITHIKRLLDVEEPVRSFLDRAIILGEKLRVVLWQFSPGFKADIRRLDLFLRILGHYPVRHTFEFRNESWFSDEVVDLCRSYNVSLCMADWPPFLDELPSTADFVYFRRHGVEGNYASDYPKAALGKDAKRIRKYLRDGKDVFVYFNNDASGFAPKNAHELLTMLKQRPLRSGRGRYS
jgi:uncharacterized protein YecE (DUF72 family)